MLAGNTVWNPWEPQGAYDALSTVTVGTAVSTITFAGIPTGYKHLQIRALGKATASAYLKTAFNGSATGYADHYIDGNGASATAGASTSATFITTFGAIANTTANVFGVIIIDLLDYANTNKNKTMRALSGVDYNGSGNIDLSSGLWANTEAINQISFTLNTGNFAQHSQFTLYGVR